MAYTVYTSADADRMVKEYKQLKTEIAELESKRGDKRTIAEMKQVLKSKGETIEAHLKKEIDGVRKNFNEHAPKMDTYLGQCVEYLKLGAEAFEKFKLTNASSDRDMATYALPTITSMVQIAKEDAAAYGAAWKEYRAANFSSAGLDPEYAEYFNTEVGKLMTDQKPVNNKVIKMEQLVVQAESLKKLTLKLANAHLRELADDREDAKELAEKMEAMFNAFKNAAKTGAQGVKQNFKTLDTAAKNKSLTQKAALKNYEGIFTNALNSIKAWKVQAKSMDAVLATGKKGFSKSDLQDEAIKKSLKAADDTVAEAKKFIKEEGEEALVKATKDMEILRKRLVK